jgi:hypothetical protein
MIQLQLLNLSWTGLKISSLSNLTNLTNLTQLSLRGCSLVESEPNFGNHTKLEVLDLSEPKITSLPSLGRLSSLRELKLRGCSGLEQLPDLKLLVHLEVLDLRETGIKGFPYEISELTSLKHLDLPDMTRIPKVDWVLINRLPEEVNWVECDILKQYRDGPCISLSVTELSDLKLGDLGKFHISVSPDIKKQRSGGDIIWHRVDRSLRDIYLQLLSIPKDHGGFLEIVGFESFPAGIEGAIVKAEYISLIDSKFVKSLSDLAAGLKAVNEGVTAMKGCMVERCTEMETIFGGEETEIKMRDNLEILRATNLPKLKSVVSVGNVEHGGFQKLTELYLDCCPALEIVFPSSQLPENLKILEIKFCDKLKTLFNPEAETEWKLQKLKKLHLVELPQLTSIGVPPAMALVKLRNCPQIRYLEEFPGIKIEKY